MNPQRENIPLHLRLGKWAGLIAGSAAWGIEQQVLSTTVYTRCPEGSAALATSVAILCALFALVGGFVSWRAMRQLPVSSPTEPDLRTHADRFIAVLSIMMAVMGLLAIAFGTPAGWILRCGR
jgi:hypothetical protein